MRTLLVALVFVSGCASMREYKAQRAAADAQDQEIAAARQRDYERQTAEQEAQRQAAIQREQQIEATCIQPPDQAWVNFCTYRERQRDRALRERDLFDRETEMMAQQTQRQAEEERRRRGTTCSSTMIGTSVISHCN